VRIENSFVAPAPVDEVWALLTDVPRVVPCMPGAELQEQVDESTWKASVAVKLGVVAMKFAAKVRQDEADLSERRLRLVADAREAKARGTARAAIEATIRPADAGSAVEIVTDLRLTGAVAQFGHAIVADVAEQLVGSFAENLRAELSGAPAAAAAQPVSGLRLLLRALLRRLRFRRRRVPSGTPEQA
jgi:carbon monoxide dehydrogenase subunit G